MHKNHIDPSSGRKNWLILMACQPIQNYYMLWSKGIAFIIHSYLLSFVQLFKSFFAHGYFKYYSFSKIYLNNRYNTNSYYHSRSVKLIVMTMKKNSTFSRATQLELYHHIQFSVIPRTPLFLRGSDPSAGDVINRAESKIVSVICQTF